MKKRKHPKKIILALLVTIAFTVTFVACEQGVVGDTTSPNASLAGPDTGKSPGSDDTESPPGTVTGTFQQQVLELTNQFRAENGVGPLESNPLLDEAAQRYAQVMAELDVMSHTGPDGSDPGTRISDVGYRWSTWGENIAMGYATPRDVVNAWILSPGHRANLLNASFKELGVGYAVGSAAYWCQDFGAP